MLTSNFYVNHIEESTRARPEIIWNIINRKEGEKEQTSGEQHSGV